MVINIDFETRSTLDLRQYGTYQYALHPTTDAWCMAYQIGDSEVEIWKMGETYPFEGFDHGESFRLSGWNSGGFERIIWNVIMHQRYGWPHMPLEQWDDTMAAARTLGLPGKLETCAGVLQVAQKDSKGHQICLRVARPRKVHEDGQIVWWDTDKAKMRALYSYCKQDVVVERQIRDLVWPVFTEQEKKVWAMDQRINDRGVRLDIPAVRGAMLCADVAVGEASKEMEKLTGGFVRSVNNPGDIRAWMRSRGVPTNTVKKEFLAELLLDNPRRFPEEIYAVAQLRLDAGKTSTAKLSKMDKLANAEDHRARGLLFYYGADTGRWAGRHVQPQNLPRGEIGPAALEEELFELLRDGEVEALSMLYGPPLLAISSSLRGMIISGDGHDLMAADLASIEARALAWLAGEERVLESFRAGIDPYVYMASRMFDIPLEEVTKDQRQRGKTVVLGAGYQMGWETFQGYAEDYGVYLSEAEAKAYIALFRSDNPNIVSFWKELNRAAIMAVCNPGKHYQAGRVWFYKDGWFLWMILPSGRRIAYAAPKIIHRPLPWDPENEQPCVRTMQVNSMTKKWSPRTLYGGLLAENATQAVARDVMVEGMFNLEAHPDYHPILTIHDEVVAEVAQGTGSVEEMSDLMCTMPAWASSLPLAADGWRGHRYRKD